MNATVASDRSIENSPQVYARIDGVLYLIVIAFGFFAEGFVMDKLIVSGDAAATAHNIMMSQSLWRMGVAADLVLVLLGIPSLLIEYALLKPAGKYLAQLALLFILVSLCIETVSKLFLFAALYPLQNAAYLSAFSPVQLQALAYLALKSHDVGWNMALIFFGCGCLINGFLIFKSRYLPRFVGVLLQLAGACYLVGCFAALFAPALYDRMAPAILVPPFIGESSLCLWLLIKGVDLPQWQQRLRLISLRPYP